jgi:D-alanyl-lipoteichoic acid acyltransferase DltB (MBOAT superfamily)
MAFNTPAFFVFWFALYLVFLSVSRVNSWKTGVLLIGNLVFFTMLTQYAVILLLVASTLDFVLAKGIHAQSKDVRKKALMWMSVLLNVGLILGFRHLSDWLQLNDMESDIHFPIPLYFIGVSFYAFRSMSYVFDVYYETIEEPETNLFHYWTYASFFPLMLSGPIAGASDFLQKLRSKTWYTDSAAVHNR